MRENIQGQGVNSFTSARRKGCGWGRGEGGGGGKKQGGCVNDFIKHIDEQSKLSKLMSTMIWQ